MVLGYLANYFMIANPTDQNTTDAYLFATGQPMSSNYGTNSLIRLYFLSSSGDGHCYGDGLRSWVASGPENRNDGPNHLHCSGLRKGMLISLLVICTYRFIIIFSYWTADPDGRLYTTEVPESQLVT